MSLYGGVIANTHGKEPAPRVSATNHACSTVSSTALGLTEPDAGSGLPAVAHAPHLAPSAMSRAFIDAVFISWVDAIAR